MARVRHLSIARTEGETAGLCDVLLISAKPRRKVARWLRANTSLSFAQIVQMMAHANRGQAQTLIVGRTEDEAMRLAESLALTGAEAGIRATV